MPGIRREVETIAARIWSLVREDEEEADPDSGSESGGEGAGGS